MSYDSVIFDFDGVLVNSGFDSFEWALEARREVIEQNDWDFTLENFKQTVFQPHTQNFRKLMDKKNISWRQLAELEKAVALKKIEMSENGELELFPPVRNLMEAIDGEKAVVTNAYGDYIREMLEGIGISEHIRFCTGPKISEIREYREKMKPSPDMIEEAVNNISGENPVMIGDQIEDILAARNAGIDSIYIDRNGDKESKADHSVRNLEEALEIIQDQT